ncbi:polyprenyl synthetase family protein [Sporolactobacillus sp. STCC-11]|uniref:polyprenyl synthetase family protein n=1 Tax=Sporolactobacillus caesalpiniae TaxID=3230362 RepID=UPI003399E5EE
MIQREQIRNYLKNYLVRCQLNSEMKSLISSLLCLKGKIFNDESVFTWAEFYYYSSLIFVSSDEQQVSHVACSSAIELLVLATDILDDLSDQDEHGEILTKMSYPQAISLSSILLMESFHIIGEYKSPHSLQAVVRQLRAAAYGQADDLSFKVSRDHIPTEQEYFAQIDRKSVSLTRLVFHLNAPVEEIPLWNEIATYIGYSGQISNDARDVFDATKNDLRDKKATLPLIKAIEASRAKDGDWLLRQLMSPDLLNNQQNLKFTYAYIKRTGAIKYCEILAEIYLNKSIQLLKRYQETSVYKEACSNLIAFLGDDDN